MKHKILSVTGHPDAQVLQLTNHYAERVNHYASCVLVDNKSRKKISERDKLIASEGDWLLENIVSADIVLLLDEKGKHITSPQLAQLLQNLQNSGTRTCISIIGGAFGVDKRIKERANHTITLSAFTLPHQLARLIWVEQLYRAYTILHNEKYHHI